MKDMKQLLQMGQQMQARMQEVQEKLASETVTASSGGGMVEATVNGRGDVQSVHLDPEVVDPGDVEMLEDLIAAAVSEAQRRAREQMEEKMQEVTGGLPGGLGGGLGKLLGG